MVGSVREPRVERRERRLLGVGDGRHEPEVIADRLADRTRSAKLPQAARAGGEGAGSLRKSNPWNRLLGESLNLAGFEDSRHA